MEGIFKNQNKKEIKTETQKKREKIIRQRNKERIVDSLGMNISNILRTIAQSVCRRMRYYYLIIVNVHTLYIYIYIYIYICIITVMRISI